MGRVAGWVIMVILVWGAWQSHTATPFLWAAAGEGGEPIQLITVGSNGTSWDGVVNSNGQVVAFASEASTLVAGDSNEQSDIFVYDTAAMTMTRVSITSVGTQVADRSFAPKISADGRWVAFTSASNNLAVGDGNPFEDGFLHNRETGETVLVTIATDGTPGNDRILVTDISADGRFVVFESATGSMVPMDKNGTYDVFVRDTVTNETTRVSVATSGAEGDGDSRKGTISGDGRYVAFVSRATNFVAGDSSNLDAFVHDRVTGETQRIAAGAGESFEAVISDDGAFIAVTSSSPLTPNDLNQNWDVFRLTLTTGAIELVSLDEKGGTIYRNVFSPTLSSDGAYVAFHTAGDGVVVGDNNHLSDLYRRNMSSGALVWVSQGLGGAAPNGEILLGALSGDGLSAVFISGASNLVSNDTFGGYDLFLRGGMIPPPPTPTPTPAPHSLYLPGAIAKTGIATYPRFTNLTLAANGNSFAPVADASGATVAFLSDATNLVEGDTNDVMDVFVWQKASGAMRRVSIAGDGTQANGASSQVALSEDGRYVLFISEASNLAAGDTNDVADLFRHDLTTGVTEWVSVGLNGAAPNGVTTGADLSADGRWVVFSSQASNLTTTPLPDSCPAVPCETLYLRDMTTGQTITWLTTDNGIALAPIRNPSLSADGQRVAYEYIVVIGYEQECNTNGTPVYGPDLYSYQNGGTPTRFAESYYASCVRPALTNDPQGYINHDPVFNPIVARGATKVVYDADTSTSTQYGGSYSYSLTTYDPTGNHNDRRLFRNSYYYSPRLTDAAGVPPVRRTITLSPDGGEAVFVTDDLNMLGEPGYSEPYIASDQNNVADLYLYDYASASYQRITDTPEGRLSNGGSREPFMAANGYVVVFSSAATNLAANDTNGMWDILVWEGVR